MRIPSARLRSRPLLLAAAAALIWACGDATAPPRPDAVELVAGDVQTDTVGATLRTPLKIRVLDERGRPLAKYAVTWTVTAGDAVVIPGAPVTDAEGGASAMVTFGSVAGEIRIVANLGVKHTMAFTATSAAGRPTKVRASVGSIRFAALADTTAIELDITDRAGNAIDTANVTWVSSDPAVVKIAKPGVAVSLTPGTATLTATVAEGLSVTLPVTVTQEIAAVAIVPGTRTFTALGDTMSLTARPLDRNNFEVPGAPLKWRSSDSTVIVVDSAGLARAVGEGTATVTVTSASASANTSFAVVQDAAELEISADTFEINAFADTVRASAIALDRNGHRIESASFVWTVADTAIAEVTVAGLITSRTNGSTVLEAAFDGISATAGVIVRQTAAEVVVTPGEHLLHALADTAQFAAVAYDANEFVIESAAFDWQSADTATAEVDDSGFVVSRGPGQTEISASLDGATGTALVLIEQIPASLVVVPAELTLSALEDTAHLAATAYDSSGYAIADATFSWESQNTSIAVVSAQGVVTGQTPGTTVVTATTGEVHGESTVTVRQSAARVALAPADVTLTAVDETTQLRAAAYDANNNVIDDASFTWSVADSTIATVSASGLVTAMRGGETLVTVRSGQAADTGIVRVVQRAVSVALETPSDSLRSFEHRLQLVATAIDRNGHPVTGRQFTWRSLRTSIVRVSSTGVASAGSVRGDAIVTATLDNETASTIVTHMPYGVLVLTIDDAYVSTYTRVFPVLQALGIRANVALPTDMVGQSGRMSLSEIRALHQAGWSILPHSLTHPDLTSLPRPEMEREIAESKAWVENQGFRGSSIFVVPKHRWGNREKDEIMKHFKAARGYANTHPSHGGMVDWPASDPYMLTSIPADEYFKTEEGRAQMEAWWIEAITTGKFVGTYIHDVREADLPAFVQMIERLAKYRDRIHTYSDLFE